MMTEKTILEKNSMLVREFDKYILEHPEFADCIPDDALVVIQLEGDEEFNTWAREAAQIAGEGHHIAFVNVMDIKPVRSRIEKLEVILAA
ncbi:MAG: DUF5647 family protein [Planctomycetota bacterium]